MKKLYRLSIYNEDGSDRHTFCQRCPKDELFNIVETYEKVYLHFERIAVDLDLTVMDLTDMEIFIYWESGHIVAEDLDTGELFSYVSVQGGYGLDPFKEISHG